MKINNDQRIVLEYIVKHPETRIQDICNYSNFGNVKVKKVISQLKPFVRSYDSDILSIKGSGISFETNHSQQYWGLIIKRKTRVSTDEKIMISICQNQEVKTMQSIADNFYVTASRVNKVISQMETEGINIVKLKKVGIIVDENLVERKRIIAKIINKYVDKYAVKSSICDLFKNIFDIVLVEADLEMADGIVKNISFTIRANEYNYYYIIALLEKVIAPKTVIRNSEVCKMFNMALDISAVEYWESRFKPIETEKNFEKIVVDLIKHIEKVEGTLYDLQYPTFKLLCHHIETIYLKKNVGTKIGMMEEQEIIERFIINYPMSYETGRHAIDYLSSVFNYELDQSEIFYVGLYFQLHKETNTVVKKLKAVVVCEYGLAMSSFLSIQIEKHFPEIIIVGTYALDDYKREAESINSSADIIFTTIRTMVDVASVMTIVVTPINFENEIELISKKLSEYKIDRFLDRIGFSQSIAVSRELSSAEDVFKYVLEKHKEHTCDDYLETVKLREEHDSTIIGNIWFPHGNPKKVHKSQIAIIGLAKPIDVKGNKIDLVVWLMLSTDDVQTYSESIRKFYGLFTDQSINLYNRKLLSCDDIRNCIYEALKK